MVKDVYSADKQLSRALQKMAKVASDEKLAQGFKKHLEQTLDEEIAMDNQSTTVATAAVNQRAQEASQTEGEK